MIGGESTFYSHLTTESSSVAVDRVITHAKRLGANGVVGMRLEVAQTMNRLIVGMHTTVVAFGTAVVVKPIRAHPRHAKDDDDM